MKKILLLSLFPLLLLILAATHSYAQVSVTTANFVYLENFNSYTGTSIGSVPQWTAAGSFSYRGVGNGSSNTGGSWSYGTGSGAGSERALGYLGSGTSSSIIYAISFVNNSGSTITKLEISYDSEQWRFESGNTLGWFVLGNGALAGVPVSGLNSNSVNSGVNGTVQVTQKSIALTGLNILPGATFGLQFSCSNGAGNDNGIAIDNFRLAVICTPTTTSVDTTLCAGAAFVVDGNSYTTPQTVTDTLTAANGCDSIVNYDLSFLPAITHSFADTTCFGTTYSWGTQNLTVSAVYNQTFASATGCDSAVTLNLFVRPAITHSFADTTCFGATYSWGTQNLTASGVYNQTFTSATGCDSTVTLNLFIRPANNTTTTQSICSGSTYTFGSQVLSTSGVYTASFLDIHGCDSNVTLTLNVGAAITHSFADTTCFGTTYSWGTQNLTASGVYNQTFTSATGCDSTVTLNLFVRPANNTTTTQSICSGSTYTFGSQVLSTSGVYTASFLDIHGCDSNVTLTLNVGAAITNNFADTTCFGTTYNWGTQSLTASGVYNQTFTSATGCDSTVTLNLFIRPAITHSFADTTCFGTTYNWGTQSLTASGVYNQTFTSATGCDSTVTLNLFIRPANNTTTTQSICSGSTYTFGSQVLSTSGVYTASFLDIHGCDSSVTLTLNVGAAITNSFADTTCFGTTYSWGTQNLTASGVYNQTFASATDCDSTVTLNLFIRPAITHSFADTTCFGTTYSWGTQSLTASGVYNQTFTSATGCDSMVTLNLFIRPANNTTTAQSICSSSTYTFGSQVLSTSGIYTASFQDIHGCDSNVTLTLNVGAAITNNFADTTCFGTTYSWGTQNLTASGVYNQTFASATGCDSTVTLNLFIRPAITHSFADTTCFGTTYNWGTQSLTASGVYNQTFTSATGCDSTVTLNLFIRPANNTTTTQSICSGSTYTFGSQVLSTSGVYTASFLDIHGCDSNVTLTLNVGAAITNSFADTSCFGTTYSWGTQNLTASGVYNQTFTSATGCDSVVTLNLFARPANNTTTTQSICSGSTYTFGSQVLSTSGIYTASFLDIYGCDSNVTLTLNVGAAITNNFADTTCFGTTYNWGTQSLTASGVYNQTFTSATGCDSTVTLNLFIRPAITHSFADTTCFGTTYNWGTQSLTASGVYNQTFTSATGCDSTVTLNLFIRPANNTSTTQSICSGSTYTFGSQVLSTSGVYTASFLDIHGCDSNVTLTLNVGAAITNSFADTSCFGTTYSWGTQNLTASGVYNQTFVSATGCDSAVTLNLFIRPANNTTTAQSICSGSTYTFGSQVLSTSGVYTASFQDIHGCDSNVTLTLNVGAAITNNFADTTCFGTTYNWGTQSLTASGVYNQTFTSATGCDSTVTLNLFIRPAITHSFADTTCFGTTYNWGTQSLTASGVYNQTFTSAAGCDSTVTLNLFIRPANNTTTTQSICSGSTYTFGSQVLSTSGVYTASFLDIHGCDSNVTLTLNVGAAITNSFADTTCFGTTYNWGTQSLTASGVYNQTFTSATGCDSTVTLNLFIRPAITHSFADTTCFGTTYSWGTQSLTASGVYNQTFTSATGCDSTVTLNLFVRPANNTSTTQSICSGSTYTFGSQVLSTSGVYTASFQDIHGCDSNVTLTLNVSAAITHSFADTTCFGTTYNWGTQSLTASGVYNQTFTSATGCDSTVTLNLFIRPANNTSTTQSICSGSTYTFGSQVLSTSGVYTASFQDIHGCDSNVTLTLNVGAAITNNFADTTCFGTTYSWGTQNLTASGVYNQTFTSATGCDSTVTLNLFVSPAITHSFADTTCFGATYSWGTQNLTTSGIYNQIFTSVTNCDSNVTLNLFVLPAIASSFADTTCFGTTYSWGTQNLTVSGIYNQTFTSVANCDSTVTLNLFVRPEITSAFSDSTCSGLTYNWGSQSLNASGVYVQTFTSATNCDSIVTLNLFVHPSITSSFADTVCALVTYTWGSLNLTSSGIYSQTFTGANGCDSLAVLHLTVRPLQQDTITASICYGATYPIGGQNPSTTGYYTATFINAHGCDSIIILNLEVSPQPVTLTIDTAACETVWFEGTAYTSYTTLTDTFSTASGCDSIYRIVNIAPHANDPVIKTIDTANCGSLVFEGILYTESTRLADTVFTHLGCDSIIRVVNIRIGKTQSQTYIHEMCEGSSFTFNGQQLNTAGLYPFTFKNQEGCDSVIIQEVRINPLPLVEISDNGPNNYCIGDSVNLEASGAQTYIWIYEDVDTFEGDYYRSILFAGKNVFLLSGTDVNGCRNTTSIHIDAQACCNIWMPNAFSPNGDGLNDIFKPETRSHPKEYVMHIYNRWGETVFSTFDVYKGWDGNINGKQADIADYYYWISGKCVNGEAINLKGICTLVR